MVWNWTSDCHPYEKTLEVDWPCHSSRSFLCENCFTLDTIRETHKGPPQDHVVMNSGERNRGAGEDLGRHQAYGKGLADVEGACCYPTCHLSVKGMSEWVRWLERPIICKLPGKLNLPPVNPGSALFNTLVAMLVMMGARKNMANKHGLANGPSPPFSLHRPMAGIVLAETVRRSIRPVDFYTFTFSFVPATESRRVALQQAALFHMYRVID